MLAILATCKTHVTKTPALLAHLCPPMSMVENQPTKRDDMSQTYVFIHGWGLNQAIWEPTMAQLPPSVQSVSLNIPGFGGEPWRPQLADFDLCVEQLANTILQYSDKPVSLVGWSLGGLLATAIALRYPERVHCLYTVASSPYFVARPEENWPGMDPLMLARFQRDLEQDFGATVKRFLAVQAMGSPSVRADIAALQKQVLSRPPADPEALRAGLQWLATVDLRAALPVLQVPLWRAYGRLDSLVPSALAQQIHEGESVVFARSAHAPFMLQPQEFLRWLRAPEDNSKTELIR